LLFFGGEAIIYFIQIYSYTFFLEYISTLEGQVDDHKKSNQLLMDRLNTVEEENKQLKQQLDNLKRQNQILQQNSLPNLNKDIGVMGSKPAETYRQDNSILVS
jgi:CII-binding regulator of phage lambda lysogenization HflD